MPLLSFMDLKVCTNKNLKDFTYSPLPQPNIFHGRLAEALNPPETGATKERASAKPTQPKSSKRRAPGTSRTLTPEHQHNTSEQTLPIQKQRNTPNKDHKHEESQKAKLWTVRSIRKQYQHYPKSNLPKTKAPKDTTRKAKTDPVKLNSEPRNEKPVVQKQAKH